MGFTPDWAPNVHPMFVHFPIGLLMTAVALDLLSLLPRTGAIRRAVPIFYAAGAVAAIATYFTGQAAADGLRIPADAEPILTRHADFALWTVFFFSAYALVRLALLALLPSPKLLVRSAFVIVAGFGLYLIWETGERGSEMVYMHGVAVAIAVEEEAAEPVRRTEVAAGALNIDDSGWILHPQARGALSHDRIEWLAGGPPNTETDTGSDGVVFELHGESVMFVVEDTLENVQVTAELAKDAFSGTITLIHHLQDSASYDYLTISGGELQLGRRTTGAQQVFDRGSATGTGWMRIRVTGDGTHFRGYMDDRMIVHGHADALPPGAVGIRIEGNGTVRLRRLQARAL